MTARELPTGTSDAALAAAGSRIDSPRFKFVFYPAASSSLAPDQSSPSQGRNPRLAHAGLFLPQRRSAATKAAAFDTQAATFER